LTTPTGAQLAQRAHPVDQLLTGGICQKCNNAWMSDLEGAAKPILVSLMRSERRIASLVREERRIVSRWTAKTAFMLDLGGLERRVPDRHLRALFTASPHVPAGLHVFAQCYARTRPWYYAAGAWWKHGGLTAEARRSVTVESYKIFLQFGDLVLCVVSWPLQNWGLRIEKNALVKLWPDTAVVKQYIHPQAQDDGTSEGLCQRHLATIGVVPRRNAEGYMGSAV
jgi:hypothetical protein